MLISNKCASQCRSMRIPREKDAVVWSPSVHEIKVEKWAISNHHRHFSHKIKQILIVHYRMLYSLLKFKHHQRLISRDPRNKRYHQQIESWIMPKSGSHRQGDRLEDWGFGVKAAARVPTHLHATKTVPAITIVMRVVRTIDSIRRCLMRQLYSRSSNKAN